MLEVAGDSFDIGQGLGKAAAYAIREIVPQLGRYQALQRDWAGSDRLDALLGAARDAYPEYVREIEGIAAGADVDFAGLFLWNCRGDIPGGGDQQHPEDAGCTTVMLARQGDAPALIAHNEDDQAELDGHCMVVRVRPRAGLGFTSFYSPGLLPGHTFGVNDAGLVQTINHVRPHDQTLGIPRHIVTRAVLGCDDLDAALAILGRQDRASGFHHNLGQAGDDRLLSVEAPASLCAVHRVTSAAAHSNHLVYAECAQIAQDTTDSSRRRQQRAQALIAEGALVHRDGLAVLGDVGDAEMPICRKHLGGIDTGYTLASAVFSLSHDAVDWQVHADPREEAVQRGRASIERTSAAHSPAAAR